MRERQNELSGWSVEQEMEKFDRVECEKYAWMNRVELSFGLSMHR